MKGSYWLQGKKWVVGFWYAGRQHKVTRYKGEFMYDAKIASKCLSVIQNRFEQSQQGLCRFQIEEFTGRGWTDVAEFFETWMKEVIEPKRKPATVKGYWSYYQNWIRPFFDDNPIMLHEIQLDTLTKFLNYVTLTGKGKYNVMNCFHSMMDYAHRSRRIPDMPPFPRKEDYNIIKPVIQWVGSETFWNIIEAMREEDRPIFLWMYFHLMREAEACALQWKDYDPINRKFTIRRSISARELVESTKTNTIYTTPCHSDFLPYLSELYSRESHRLDDFIFQNVRAKQPGQRYTNESINKAWKRACLQVGVKIRPYAGVRHSRASQMRNELGMSRHEVFEAGTWKRLDSVDKYGDLGLERKRELLEKKVIDLTTTKLPKKIKGSEIN